MAEWLITEPGIYDGMPAEVYHADPVPEGSLSSSGAKRLLPPSCPALFRYADKPATRRMEHGTAAHTVVLGAGAGLHRIEADDWRKNATKAEAEAARGEGLTPVLAAAHDRILAMAAALRRHRAASLLFAPGSGLAEQSAFWHDTEYTVGGGPLWRRCRYDWLPHGAGGVILVPDYKTSERADPDFTARQIATMGYYQQGAWYRDGVAALRPGFEVRFVLVVQETSPPYLVGCYNLHPRSLALGAAKNRRAMEIWRDCTESGVWPGYDPFEGIATLDLPRWAYPYDSEDY
jgi:PDDEXK-like uncharacterized protein DUF3799